MRQINTKYLLESAEFQFENIKMYKSKIQINKIEVAVCYIIKITAFYCMKLLKHMKVYTVYANI